MDIASDIPDSTDWLETSLKDFVQLESALHCQICKEFYNTPMVTSCSHSFCSRCIRTSLSADGRCPACRTPDQASRLRNNWALQEVVATFLAARPTAIRVARREQLEAQQAKRPGKRKRVVAGLDDVEEAGAGSRTTRSKSRKMAASQTSNPDVIEVDDSEDDDAYEPEAAADDGLVECPLGCGKRMKIEQVEPHLDRCEDEKQEVKKLTFRRPAQQSQRESERQSPRPQDRLAELNYSLLKEQPMRKKLEEIGIPAWGTKQLMVKRHTEWVNLWNANCDSNLPRSKRDLLQDLDSWERTQGGRAPTANAMSTNVMRKDFDGTGWANKNKDDFSRLIADARRKKEIEDTTSDPPKAEVEDDHPMPKMDGKENGSPHVDVPPITEPSALDSATSAPYADNTDAMASIRDKVEAANEGRHIEPLMNEDFRNTAFDTTSPISTPKHHDDDEYEQPVQGSQNEALLSEGLRSIRREVSGDDEHTRRQRTGSPCLMAAHLHNASTRQVPMFELPSEPVKDLDGAGEGTHF
ncbi:hypothetical protein LTR62_006002 [Meristemomyces frigidus]|uniref:Postreplication repair E3 ubiquitin-protein ligase RAD18 n=1 Tax=Meristemomyces frigidus TaxID=1508187 RepID=A0AAN7TQR0_9PEZI|nr:hypothetical protein LTR62_006002 [Meristemomyces frigidus]